MMDSNIYSGSNSTAQSPAKDGTANPPAGTQPNAKPVGKKPTAGERLANDIREYERVASEVRSKLATNLPEHLRRRQVVDTATELFGVAPTWVSFFREIMGTKGVIEQLFTDKEERVAFETSAENSQILEMLTALRSRDLPENDPSESQRMITVRIPTSLHEWICEEANRLEVSVNKLCISRLTQRLDRNTIPSSQQKRRGRKPGAAENRKTMKERAEEKAADDSTRHESRPQASPSFGVAGSPIGHVPPRQPSQSPNNTSSFGNNSGSYRPGFRG